MELKKNFSGGHFPTVIHRKGFINSLSRREKRGKKNPQTPNSSTGHTLLNTYIRARTHQNTNVRNKMKPARQKVRFQNAGPRSVFYNRSGRWLYTESRRVWLASWLLTPMISKSLSSLSSAWGISSITRSSSGFRMCSMSSKMGCKSQGSRRTCRNTVSFFSAGDRGKRTGQLRGARGGGEKLPAF